MHKRWISIAFVSIVGLLFFIGWIHVALTAAPNQISESFHQNCWLIIPAIIRALSIPTIENFIGGSFMLIGIAGGISYPLIHRRKK